MARRPEDDGQVNMVIRFPVELHEQTKQFARAEDMNMSQLVRRAVRMYLEHGTQLPAPS